MKLKNSKQKTWVFVPRTNSLLRNKSFKYKSDLMKYLNNNFNEVINGTIRLEFDYFGMFHTSKEWLVWVKSNFLEIELRQLSFSRTKTQKVKKEDKKYFTYSDKIINLMCYIDKLDVISPNHIKNLVKLFYKRGFKDFILNEDEQEYVNYYINNGIDFFHWSDRCNTLRTKTIIEYFKHKYENILL